MGLYPSFVKHVLNPLDLWRSGDYAEIRYWKEFERTQFLPADELEQLHWRRLTHILDVAYRKIPYYKAAFDKVGVLPSDIKNAADMLALPVLEKRDLQAHLPAMLNPDWPKDKLVFDKTGGSTGTPVHYYYSMDRKWSRQAAAVRHDRWTGYDIGDARAALWGAARDMPALGSKTALKQRLRALIFPKELLLNTVEMTPEIMLDFNRKLKKYRPSVILAYANAMALFAAFLKSAGATAYSPKAIISSAEMLRPEDRTLIEAVFDAPVFDRLGCREVALIASECPVHDGMHVNAESLHLEIVRGDQHVEPGETGEILVTDMLNEAMPLIRYRLGDTATWLPGHCECGRNLPRITGLAGRVTDFLLGMDERFCSGAALTALIVSARPSLGQIQIIQEERGTILYRVGCGANRTLSDEDLAYLREKTELYLGQGIKIDYEFIDKIPHEESGKFVFSKSKVAREWFR